MSISQKKIVENIKKFARHFDPIGKKMAKKVDFQIPESLEQKVARMVRDVQIQNSLKADGFETFEESEDFDVDEPDIVPPTRYELDFDPIEERRIYQSGLEARKHAPPARQKEAEPEPKPPEKKVPDQK